MKKVLILGSTGSIGKNTVEVIKTFSERFKAVGLVAGRDAKTLKKQAEELKPDAVCLVESKKKVEGFKTYNGIEGLKALIEELEFDICVSAITGAAGILPTYWAAKKCERLALANKESLVCAGKFIREVAKEIIPVDSEHSALFQCLNGEDMASVEEIVLTASGGPFLRRENLENVTVEEALKHPNWNMGVKVTIDSATMMNKGLEVIEAYWLFNIPLEKIKVLVHPQSIVHSLVRFVDNSVVSQMAVPDMRIPIAYALSYPERLPLKLESLHLNLHGKSLEFEEPDTDRFPCLKLAYEALERGYPYPIVLNAADEVAVNLFVEGKIPFTSIPKIVKVTIDKSNFEEPETVKDVLTIDQQARELALKVAKCL